MFEPRPAQKAILDYKGGTMGIAAVPGSGKTWTLSRLAASLIIDDRLEDDQEILIVTLVNSAVDNFRKRIAAFLTEEGLVPGVGYRVSTLHSLAFEILSRAPASVGLPEDFGVADDRVSNELLTGAFRASFNRYAPALEAYLKPDVNEGRRRIIMRDQLPRQMENAARNAISHLKNRRISHQALRALLQDESPVMALLAADVYERYQQGLALQSALDFNDLITLAIQALEQDASLVAQLRAEWPFILEDEAQDSSHLQEQIVRMLTGPNGNWVRVGDPNQAIYETFTTANPRFLREFLDEADARRHLPNSGRSGRPIINLANELIRWVKDEHPVLEVSNALDEPLIEPTPPGDPQPNPSDEACGIWFHFNQEDPKGELATCITSLGRWLPHHPDETVAVLVPTHFAGNEVISALQAARLPFTDALLRLTMSTKQAAGALSLVLQHLSRPEQAEMLPVLFKVYVQRVLRPEEEEGARERLDQQAARLADCPRIEDFLHPGPAGDWLAEHEEELDEETLSLFAAFRAKLRAWHRLVMLPIGELLTALAQDLFEEPEKLAMTQLFGEDLARRAERHVHQGQNEVPVTLSDFQRELAGIARDQRKLRSIEADKLGFDPEAHKGEVAVATMHGAKGLEWDRVYLLGVNDYDFPAGLIDESFQAEKWYVRDELNLEAEALAQLDALIDQSEYEEKAATLQARYEYARERLRLLYVGITRARQELVIMSNVGRFNKNKPSAAFEALKAYHHRKNGLS